MMTMKRKKRPLDSVEAYSCMCMTAICNCPSTCGCDHMKGDLATNRDFVYNDISFNVNHAAIRQIHFPGP